MRTAALLLAAASTIACGAASTACGPSASNFAVVPLLPGTSVPTAQAACSAYSMDMLALTNANFNEVSSLVFSCLGPLRQALIKSWNGNNYGVPCLMAYVSTSTGGMGVAAPPTCPPPQAVVCQPRPGVPINLPTNATTTAVVTATKSTTAVVTSTIPPSTTETVSETTTSTTVSTATVYNNVCVPSRSNSKYVFVPAPGITSAMAESRCSALGLTLGFISDLTDIAQFNPCLLPGQTYWMQPVTVSNAYGTTLSFMANGTLAPTNVSARYFSSQPIGTASNFDVLCANLSGPTPVYNYIPIVASNPTMAQTICANRMPQQSFAIYPPSSNGPPINGLGPGISRQTWIAGAQLPMAPQCAFLRNNDPSGGAVIQRMYFYIGPCNSTIVEGVLCERPAL